MIVREFKKEISGKNKKQYRIFCVKRCDECGDEKIVQLDGVKLSRSTRNSDLDLCRSCSNLVKYKGRLPRGKKNKNFKHGLHSSGYRLLTVEDGRKCFEHQYAYEEHIGRRLKKEERIHHIDFNKVNNKISNLYLCNLVSDHSHIHHQMENLGYDLLNESIWFDIVSKKYVLDYVDAPLNDEEFKLDIIGLYKTYNKRSGKFYYRCYYQDGEGIKRTRGYHLVLMEKKIGRKLFINECVHHINGNTLDNIMNNLLVMTRSEHMNAHISLQHCVAELYKKNIVGFNRENGNYFVI